MTIAKIDFVDAASTPILPEFLMSEDLATHAASKGPVKFFTRY